MKYTNKDINRKHIMQVNIDNDGGNGAFALMYYIYKVLKDDFIFDYFTMGNFKIDDVYDNIIKDGGKCFSANLRKNKLIGHIKLPFVFYKVLKEYNYEVVHIHSEVAYKHFLYAIAAKKAGVRKIIIHSHSCNIDGDKKGIKYIFHKLVKNRINKLGTYFLACSSPAAEWLFTNKTLHSNNYKLLHNGILPDSYKYSDEKRNKIRIKLGISEKIVIGHVGALKKVKNQSRLLDIMHDLNDNNYILLLVGDGEDRKEIELKLKSLNLENKVVLLGSRTDVSDLLQAFDVFMFPSLFEGIPMALIEAQAVGVPIIASDTINKEVAINNNVSFVSLNDNNHEWINKIKKVKNNHIKENGFINVSNSDYNIRSSAKILKELYK